MNINEVDLITITVDLDSILLHPPFTQLKERALLCFELLDIDKTTCLVLKGPSIYILKKHTRKSLRKTLIDLVSLRSVCP